ncbi:transcription factor Tfb2 [Piedraia hortae CBS 480.64]|uniref:RNA polymerase II transcription factor B subunit 2 n=1 Tax=Piedraia hortae CBS 480.64 TaxID=1314780 RepID=A0A6A7BY42_9PEZI|nr:transcription factor Tfb2 [Piedraia hortae CBS 480.64]
MSSTASSRALDYLELLPGTTFLKLYRQPSTCLAIFRRMLPHLAKTLVMALLYMPEPLSRSDLHMWFKNDNASSSARTRAISILQRLRILFDARDANSKSAYVLSTEFSKGLRLALTGGGQHYSFGVPSHTPDTNPPDIADLDIFARQRWEAILYFVAGSSGLGFVDTVRPSASTKQVLTDARFVAGSVNSPRITKEGFEFLLQDVNTQVWTLLIKYLSMADKLDMDQVETMTFLFMLGSAELGMGYALPAENEHSSNQSKLLSDLQDFGLIMVRGERYYPTRLATTLTNDAPALLSTTSGSGKGEGEKGFVLVETNFRLYAYTSSPLLISIIQLFAALRTRYPNLITAKITKSSVRRAMEAGITSDQIISYLQTHAHPIVRRQVPSLPHTVVDQIRLWQIEGERMVTNSGYLIRDCGSEQDFNKAVEYADKLGVLKKTFKTRGSFFVTRMDQMQEYFKAEARNKKEAERKKTGGRLD